MLWSWLPVVVLSMADGGPADASVAQFVQASMMIVRAGSKEDAPVVEKLPIGTAVTMEPLKDGEWCKVGAQGRPALGFSICSLAGPVRPTLEAVQKEIDALVERGEKSKVRMVDKRRYRDLIARKFFLSPSILTIFEYNLQLYHSDFGPFSDSGMHGNLQVDKLVEELLAAYQGEIGGTDLRPVIRSWNRFQPVGNEQFDPKNPDPNHYLLWDRSRVTLPKVSPSMFNSPDDIYVLGGWLEIGRLRRHGKLAQKDGRVEARYVVGNLSTPGSYVVEFLKLLPEFRPMVSQGGPFNGPYGLSALGKVGSVEHKFEHQRPPVWIITTEGISQGSVVMVKQWLGYLGCGNIQPVVHLAMPRPIDGRILVALIPAVKAPSVQPKIRRLGGPSWAMDLDGDGVFDLAYLDGIKPEGRDEQVFEGGYYLVNVKGEWRVALESREPICT